MAGSKLLVCNVHFAPSSFGGATIVTENLAFALAELHDWQVCVFTTMQVPNMLPYERRRYVCRGVEVYGVNLPVHLRTPEEDYENSHISAIFSSLLDRVCPDVAHIHSIQGMGVGLLDALADRSIPFAVTIHDCWWICERQFMINSQNRYCFQDRIDPDVCKFCVSDMERSRRRSARLREALGRADRLLFPSAFQKDLYVANEFSAPKCSINKNGIKEPGSPRAGSIRSNEGIVFGFVGGPGPIKGADLITRAFRELDYTNYELRVVDAAQHLGHSWRYDPVWNIPGKLTFVPAYTQDSIDDFFDGIDVLLFPSQWKESFGLTVREALVRGIWVIATEGGGVIEDCIDGVNSTIVPLDGTHTAIKEAIAEILKRGAAVRPTRSKVTTVTEQASELNLYLRGIINGSKDRAREFFAY